jgi:TetR/AcrR family transcriptional regulator, transcriptional repressor for nem operon
MSETKDRILSIALYFFIKKSYTEVTMSEILKASGLSKGGFYHHFESKEILYHEVIDKFILGSFLTEYSHFTINHNNLPFCEFVPVYIKSTLEHLIELAEQKIGEFKIKIDEINLYMVMFDMMKHYKGFDKMLDNLHQSEIIMFKELVDTAKKNGEIKKEIDSLAIANHVHTLMHGICVLAMFDENMDNIEIKIREHFNNFYQLIKV